MDPQGNPMPPDFPLVSPVPADIPHPPVPQPVMLGPFPMGKNNLVGEYLFLEQTLVNNLAMNDLIIKKMAQIYHDMGWDIQLEDFALVQLDEGQPDVPNME